MLLEIITFPRSISYILTIYGYAESSVEYVCTFGVIKCVGTEENMLSYDWQERRGVGRRQ